MRWIPLLVVLSLSFISGLYILGSIDEVKRRSVFLIRLTYLTFLGVILFTPLSFDGVAVYIMPAGIGRVNLHYIYVGLGFIENIILTIPLGFLIKKIFPNMSLILIVPLSFIMGVGFELTQYYLSHTFLINRVSDINDVIANGIGVAVGATLALVYYYVYEKKLSKKKFRISVRRYEG
ncbi:VanZ family protein [Companilactobacillus jidongensis]|uniref:VanZ family protein n=1 Tax=Companilactobacillus jidongensis TaxID=2486006 RepID=UPI000F7AF7EA|nr:VanZ family protein [Companilactobacillus jidongensis]